MRKLLEAISLIGLTFMVCLTWWALNGPVPLPQRIPMHFDAAGNANAWGSPATLWLLPVFAVALYLFITLISLLPTGFKSAVNLSTENRARLEALTHQMVAWIKLELICLFIWIQWSILQSVQQGSESISPLAVPVFIVTVFATLGLYALAIIRALRAESGS
jgi:uncharacterized membrane protein